MIKKFEKDNDKEWALDITTMFIGVLYCYCLYTSTLSVLNNLVKMSKMSKMLTHGE